MKIKMIFLTFGALVFLYFLSFGLDLSGGRNPRLGATFSQFYAGEIIGLDWKKSYESLINELKPPMLRLIAYWQYLEPSAGEFNFEDLDWQVEKARESKAEVVLVIGQRVPRWPECHVPDWVKKLPEEEFRNRLLDYLREVVEHYKSFSNIKVWQVENEPLLSVFGECPKPARDFLEKEIELVKKLDPSRPVMVTDSGELSLWWRTGRLGDILGTTLYRIVWDKRLDWVRYPYPPALYAAKGAIVRKLYGEKEIIISELQAEPWAKGGGRLVALPFDVQVERFNPEELRRTVEFAKKTGFKDAYLWGVEWWYWRKIQGDDSWWESGKKFFSGDF